MSLKQWGIGVLCCSTLLLTACRVVDLDENGKPIIPPDPNAKASFANMTPAQIAQQTWDSRVSAPARDHALDAATLPNSPTPQSVFVRLHSNIEKVDLTNARERSVTVTLNNKPLEVQIGPLIRGNAVRDAAGFKFEDFTNQVQFAQLSKAYNREAVKHLPPVDASWQQQPVTMLIAGNLKDGVLSDAVALDIQQGAK
ncbi:DUF2291 family protein [Atlantibacter subterraneus]|jgi:predicted lipoprotein|uniref:DUF2291 family protein n=1 Tax=Atlantibacter subterraneus TaxID=255519 RepID=A0ABU4E677_9ENTR|nr:DUF2291 family protein [Atlantibacter subterranea]MDZ5667143.1 DUF2291 family protein [Atlantibacter hermannii]QFH71405.1 DUF2291 family protein [Enterobacter sp. E76]MDV7024047.1 DUF2291 family protein [Atlantibacter subterranea]MDW2743199.1 DUF2291 family protein [Atlantibacter subterranea]TSJ51763.1 DUF2291 family protein [Atlantibacter subterranea]